ncbi:MAG: 30S ribosomal protein S16 [bacterium]|nr:30S ribosomal protein S16 [bacterium]
MALRIRLTRLGAKKRPFYRIVVIDSRKSRDGEYLDLIGNYDPLKDPAEIRINTEKAISWMQKGAKPSDTVKQIFSRQGVI